MKNLATLVAVGALVCFMAPSPVAQAKEAALTDADLAMAFAESGNRKASSFSEQLVCRLRLEGGGDGYIRLLVTNVANADGRAEVKFGLTLPDGRKVRHEERKKRGDWSYGTERFEATVGAARFTADTKEATIRVDGGDFEAELKLDLGHGPVRPKGGGADFGEGRSYRTTVLGVRAGVSGRVAFDDGETVDLDGEAFLVHRAGNIAPYAMAKRWYNLLEIGPEETIALSAFQEPGGQVHGWLYVATDDRLVVAAPDVALKPDRIRKDDESPYSTPRVLHLRGEGGLEGVVKSTAFEERKDDLARLSRVERFVVERLMKPWTYRYRADYLVRKGGEILARGSARYTYQQLKP